MASNDNQGTAEIWNRIKSYVHANDLCSFVEIGLGIAESTKNYSTIVLWYIATHAPRFYLTKLSTEIYSLRNSSVKDCEFVVKMRGFVGPIRHFKHTQQVHHTPMEKHLHGYTSLGINLFYRKKKKKEKS